MIKKLLPILGLVDTVQKGWNDDTYDFIVVINFHIYEVGEKIKSCQEIKPKSFYKVKNSRQKVIYMEYLGDHEFGSLKRDTIDYTDSSIYPGLFVQLEKDFEEKTFGYEIREIIRLV